MTTDRYGNTEKYGEIGPDPDETEQDYLAEYQDLARFERDIANVRDEWENYKQTDQPVYLLRVIGSLQSIAATHDIGMKSVYQKAGGDIAAFGTPAVFRHFALKEAARHVQEQDPLSDAYKRTGYIFERLGLKLGTGGEVYVHRHPVFRERQPLLDEFARVVDRPIIHYASNWAGRPVTHSGSKWGAGDFEGFKPPVVELR